MFHRSKEQTLQKRNIDLDEFDASKQEEYAQKSREKAEEITEGDWEMDSVPQKNLKKNFFMNIVSAIWHGVDVWIHTGCSFLSYLASWLITIGTWYWILKINNDNIIVFLCGWFLLGFLPVQVYRRLSNGFQGKELLKVFLYSFIPFFGHYIIWMSFFCSKPKNNKERNMRLTNIF